MAKKNYGKEFERQVYKNFSEIEDLSIDRIPDQVTRYKGSSSNICDFIVYKKPILLYLECKTTHGASLSIYSEPKPDKKGELHGFYGNIRDNQWNGLAKKSKIPGIRAGVMIWFVDKDVTMYVPIEVLQYLRSIGQKSIRFDEYDDINIIDMSAFVTSVHKEKSVHKDDVLYRSLFVIKGTKKRTMFEYDFSEFFCNLS